MHVLVIPTHWESRAVLKALPGAVRDPEQDIPNWPT